MFVGVSCKLRFLCHAIVCGLKFISLLISIDALTMAPCFRSATTANFIPCGGGFSLPVTGHLAAQAEAYGADGILILSP